MNSWLQIFPTKGTRARLVCLPRAGGNSADFAHWVKPLENEIQVCAVQLPGRLQRFTEPALRTVPSIACAVAGALRNFDDLPMVLFGDCMGAILAFEIARQLRRSNAFLPANLIVSSYPCPDLPRTSPKFHNAPTETFRKHLLDVGGIPPEIVEDDELFSLILPTLRADFEAFESYKYIPEPPLALDLYAIIGEANPYVSVSVLEGWKRQTCQNFFMRTFRGGHFFLQGNQAVLEFIREIVSPVTDSEEK